MLTGLSAYQRQAAVVAREVQLLRQAASPPPPRTAVELAVDLGIGLDAWQADALTTAARDILLLASRQAGKSTVSGIMANEAPVGLNFFIPIEDALRVLALKPPA